MSKCGHPEKGLTCGPECQPVAIVPSDPDDPRFDGVVVSRSVEKRVALQKGEPMPTFASGGALSALTEIDIVKRILSAHQTAYAQAHNTEGRNVIESDQIAIGYASVELAKLLAAHDQAKLSVAHDYGKPTLTFGDGEYSCASCGVGMREPCQHWRGFLETCGSSQP